MTNRSHDQKPDKSKRTADSSDSQSDATSIEYASLALDLAASTPCLTPKVVLQLQRTAGNQAVSRLIDQQNSERSAAAVQRVPGQTRPRLSEPEVRSATPRGAYIRLTFNMQWSRAEAVAYLWPDGPQPAANFFMPDAADAMGSEISGYENFLILPNAAVLTGIRPEVHRLIYQSIPESAGGVELPAIVPQELQRQIQSELSGDGDMTLSGAWPSATEPTGLYWVRRTGRRTEVQAAQLPSPDDAENRRVRDARRTVNRDITHFVVEDQISITAAKERVRRIHASILRLMLVGYLEAIMIFGGANPTVGGRFAHDFVPDGEE